jgi:thymidylate synthase (FAD)
MIYKKQLLKEVEPTVKLLQNSPILLGEIAARTCYKSGEKSNNDNVVEFFKTLDTVNIQHVDNVDLTLLKNLSWVQQHESILEHIVLTYYIKDLDRGTLQENARHRIQSLSVQSTRYTMAEILYGFYITKLLIKNSNKHSIFVEFMDRLDVIMVSDRKFKEIEYTAIYDKLNYIFSRVGSSQFTDLILTDKIKDYLWERDYQCRTVDDIFSILEILKTFKGKRNVGDPFKLIVTDNWKVDLVQTFNLRSLKNFLRLRTSNAAYYRINRLANKIIEVTPDDYLSLIHKEYKDKNV